RTLADPEIVPVENGGRVRVRIINGAAATAFTMDFGQLTGTLIAVDGQAIHPIKGRRFPIVMGQRIDVLLRLPRQRKSFPILALREGGRDQTGILLRTTGASVAKLPTAASVEGPRVNLSLEARLHALSPLKSRRTHRIFGMTLTGTMQGYRW